jgi:isocitrate lyase
MFDLASGYRERGMAAYSELQQREFAREKDGYTCESPLYRLSALLAVCLVPLIL